MNYKFKVFAGLVATGGIVGLSCLSMNDKRSANLADLKKPSEVKSSVINQAVSRKKAYSWQLVKPYTSRCQNKLQKKGVSSDIAMSVCECSLEQMQTKYTQKQAIGILIKASKSKTEDPNTGMPQALSGYFTPCMLGASK